MTESYIFTVCACDAPYCFLKQLEYILLSILFMHTLAKVGSTWLDVVNKIIPYCLWLSRSWVRSWRWFCSVVEGHVQRPVKVRDTPATAVGVCPCPWEYQQKLWERYEPPFARQCQNKWLQWNLRIRDTQETEKLSWILRWSYFSGPFLCTE